MIKQRVTAQKRNRIFLCFKNDLTATQAADICGVNRNTVNRYYNLLHRVILSESIREARAGEARGQGVRDGRARLFEGVAYAGHKGSNP